jgi:hypothetical protein
VVLPSNEEEEEKEMEYPKKVVAVGWLKNRINHPSIRNRRDHTSTKNM